MNRVYQPVVLQKTKELITILEETNFFKEYQIESTEYAELYFKNLLTEKFILGQLDITDDVDLEIFTDTEFGEILNRIISGSVLYELKAKGLVNSYEDEDTEETFFLTSKGKKYIEDEFKDSSSNLTEE
jgi:hypothetical protein